MLYRIAAPLLDWAVTVVIVLLPWRFSLTDNPVGMVLNVGREVPKLAAETST